MKKLLITILTIACICSVAFAASKFKDVSDDHWASNSIDRWADEGVISGYPAGDYKPENNITRAEFCAMICRLLDPVKTSELSKYKDVDDTAWYASFISRCLGAKILDEASELTLKPNGLVTRQEAVVMLNAFIQISPVKGQELIKKFTDYDEIADYAENDVEAFADSGRIIGYEDGSFRPNEPISRAEMATILDRLIHSIITKPGEYDLTGTNSVVIIKSTGVTLKGANNAIIIYLNDEVKASTKGVTDASKKNSVVVNPAEKSESKTTSRSTSGGGSQSSGTSTKTAVITITTADNGMVEYYKIARNGVDVADGKKITVRVDGKTIVSGKVVNEDSLIGLMITIANALDVEKVINTIDITDMYREDENIEKWGAMAIKEAIEDLERIAVLAQAANDNPEHKIKAVFDELTGDEVQLVLDTALAILQEAYNGTLDNDEANALVSFDYVLGELNSANV